MTTNSYFSTSLPPLSHSESNLIMIASFRDKIDMAVRLFGALKSESQFLRLVIQEAASSLATAYKVIFVLPICPFL